MLLQLDSLLCVLQKFITLLPEPPTSLHHLIEQLPSKRGTYTLTTCHSIYFINTWLC